MTEAMFFATGVAFGFASTVGTLAWSALGRHQARADQDQEPRR